MGRAHEVRAASMAKTAAKKSAANGRAAKEIYIAAKKGGSDPNSNLELRNLMDKFKSQQIPNDVIQRAIKRSQGSDSENYVSGRYEALGPGGSAILIDVLTSNVNRAAAQVREILNKNNGNVEGKVAFLFKSASVFAFENKNVDDVLEYLLMNDLIIDNVEEKNDMVFVYAPFKDFAIVKKVLDEFGVKDYLISETQMLPIDGSIELSETDNEQLINLLNKLEDLEDVQNIYHNVNLK